MLISQIRGEIMDCPNGCNTKLKRYRANPAAAVTWGFWSCDICHTIFYEPAPEHNISRQIDGQLISKEHNEPRPDDYSITFGSSEPKITKAEIRDDFNRC